MSIKIDEWLKKMDKWGNEEVIDQIDEWLHDTRQKLTVREIEALRKIGYDATWEINGLKNNQEGKTIKGETDGTN